MNEGVVETTRCNRAAAGVDPLAVLDFSETPYDYVDNNSLNRIDPTGCADCDGNGTDDGDCVNGGTFDDVVITAKKTVNVGVFNYIMSSINSFDPLGLENHYKYLREHGNDENWLKVKKSFVEGGNVAAVVGAVPLAAMTLAEGGLAYITSLAWKSVGRKALWNIAAQSYGNIIKGEKKFDIWGLVMDSFLPGKQLAILSGYYEAGVEYKDGKFEFFGEYQGSVKRTARALLGIGAGKFQDKIGSSGVGKFVEGTYEAMGKIYTESNEAAIDEIERSYKK